MARVQEVDVLSQLGLGVRLLQAQTHDNNGELHFCHTSCELFDGGTVQDYLTTVKQFLDANPNEVITLLFTNPDALSLPDQWEPAFVNSGINDLAYVPPSLPVKQSDWPTLGDMIDSGKRVVVFLDAGANGVDGGIVNFILPEFDMVGDLSTLCFIRLFLYSAKQVWETPFSVTNPSFPCSVDRITGDLPTVDHMYLINHSLNKEILPFDGGITVSDPEDAPTTNGVPSYVHLLE